jgi:hypothetical protein
MEDVPPPVIRASPAGMLSTVESSALFLMRISPVSGETDLLKLMVRLEVAAAVIVPVAGDRVVTAGTSAVTIDKFF